MVLAHSDEAMNGKPITDPPPRSCHGGQGRRDQGSDRRRRASSTCSRAPSSQDGARAGHGRRSPTRCRCSTTMLKKLRRRQGGARSRRRGCAPRSSACSSCWSAPRSRSSRGCASRGRSRCWRGAPTRSRAAISRPASRSRSGDEIGMLGENFNFMADQLADPAARDRREGDAREGARGRAHDPGDAGAADRSGRARVRQARRLLPAGVAVRRRLVDVCTTCPTGAILVVIGDVTGHGVPSAMITAAAKAACDVVRATEGDKLTVHAPARDHEPRDLRERQAQVRDDLLRVDPRPEGAHHHVRQRRPQLPVPVPARRGRRQRVPVLMSRGNRLGDLRGVEVRGEDAPSSAPATSSSGTPTASSSARTTAARSTARSASARRSAAPPRSTRWDARERRRRRRAVLRRARRARTTSPWCSRGSRHDAAPARIAAAVRRW